MAKQEIVFRKKVSLGGKGWTQSRMQKVAALAECPDCGTFLDADSMTIDQHRAVAECCDCSQKVALQFCEDGTVIGRRCSVLSPRPQKHRSNKRKKTIGPSTPVNEDKIPWTVLSVIGVVFAGVVIGGGFLAFHLIHDNGTQVTSRQSANTRSDDASSDHESDVSGDKQTKPATAFDHLLGNYYYEIDAVVGGPKGEKFVENEESRLPRILVSKTKSAGESKYSVTLNGKQWNGDSLENLSLQVPVAVLGEEFQRMLAPKLAEHAKLQLEVKDEKLVGTLVDYPKYRPPRTVPGIGNGTAYVPGNYGYSKLTCSIYKPRLHHPNVVPALADVPKGDAKNVWLGHGNKITSVVKIPKSNRILAGSSEGRVREWNVSTGKNDILWESGASVTDLAITHDGDIVAVAHEDGTVDLVKRASGKVVRTIAADFSRVLAVTFDIDGKTLFTSGFDSVIKQWNAETGELLLEMNGHPRPITKLLTSPDGRTLYSAGLDGVVAAWDLPTGNEAGIYTGTGAGLNTLAISPDGNYLVAGTNERVGKTLIWRKGQYQPIATRVGGEYGVTAVTFLKNQGIATASRDGRFSVWNPLTQPHNKEYQGHTHTVHGIVELDGGQLITAGEDKTVRVWSVDQQPLVDLEKLKVLDQKTELLTQKLPVEQADRLVLLGDGTRAMAIGGGGIVSVCDLRSGRIICQKRDAPFSSVTHVSQGANTVAVASEDGPTGLQVRMLTVGVKERKLDETFQNKTVSMNIIEAKSSEIKLPEVYLSAAEATRLRNRSGSISGLDNHHKKNHFVSALAVSPNGKWIGVATGHGYLTIYDSDSGDIASTIKLYAQQLSSLVFLDNHQLICGRTAMVTIGDKPTRTGIHGPNLLYTSKAAKPQNDKPNQPSVIISAEKKLYATAIGKMIFIIRLGKNEKGEDQSEIVAEFRSHQSDVTTLAVSKDGKQLASADTNSVVRIWDINSATVIAEFEEGALGRHSLAFSNDGKSLLIPDADGAINAYSISALSQLPIKQPYLKRFMTKKEMKGIPVVLPDGKHLAFVERRIDRGHLYDLSKGVYTGETIGFIEQSWPNYKFYLGSSGRIYRLDDKRPYQKRRPVVELKRPEPDPNDPLYSSTKVAVTAIAISPDEKTVLAGRRNGRVDLHSMKTGDILKSNTSFDKSVEFVAASPDGKSFVVEFVLSVHVIDSETLESQTKIEGVSHISKLKFHPTRAIAVATGYSTVAFDLETGEKLLDVHSSPDADFVLDGRYLAVANGTYSNEWRLGVNFIDTKTWKPVKQINEIGKVISIAVNHEKNGMFVTDDRGIFTLELPRVFNEPPLNE